MKAQISLIFLIQKFTKITSPKPQRKDTFLFCFSNLHELTTVSHRSFIQIWSAEYCQWEQIWKESMFEGSALWSKLWIITREFWKKSPLIQSLQTTSEKLWHQQETWLKRRKFSIRLRLLQWSKKIILAQIWQSKTSF